MSDDLQIGLITCDRNAMYDMCNAYIDKASEYCDSMLVDSGLWV